MERGGEAIGDRNAGETLPVHRVAGVPRPLPLAECFELQPVLEGNTLRVFQEAAARRERDRKYNNVLDRELPPERCEDSSWCSCEAADGVSGCSKRKQPRSCYCCKESATAFTKEAEGLLAKTTGVPCVARHPEFERVALDRTVVNVSARLMAETGRNAVYKENYNNNELRYAAYRSAALWMFGRLGRRVRRVLPSCVVRAICRAFPKLRGEKRVGYRAPWELDGSGSSDSDSRDGAEADPDTNVGEDSSGEMETD